MTECGSSAPPHSRDVYRFFFFAGAFFAGFAAGFFAAGFFAAGFFFAGAFFAALSFPVHSHPMICLLSSQCDFVTFSPQRAWNSG